MMGTDDKMPVAEKGILIFFKRLKNKIAGLFEPEEVEVTFKVEGKQVKYTYTKVEHKRVA